MSNQFTTAVIGEDGLRRVMEGVRTVRLVAALAVAAMLAGGWMMNTPFDEIIDDDGTVNAEGFAAADAEDDSEE